MVLTERMLCMVLGVVLDACFGDPRWFPHPVVLMGRAISALEKLLRRVFRPTPRGELAAGVVMAVVLPLCSFGLGWLLLWAAGLAGFWLRAALEVFLCYQLLAVKSLRQAAMEVCQPLQRGDLPAARRAVGMIVGRETDRLGAQEIARATVETVAENTSDGAVAPLFWFVLGGAPLALAYKAVNTMDSMLGYKNDRYLYFGRAAARLDDAANWLPARLTGLLMVLAAFAGFDGRGAWRIWRRDRRNHSSPNAGQPEAACAGALGVRLGGDSVYFGRVVHKDTLGDDARPLRAEDIRRACRLMQQTVALAVLAGVLGLGAVWGLGGFGWN